MIDDKYGCICNCNLVRLDKSEVATSLRILNSLAKILHNQRMKNGALTLSSPEVKFIKDEETQNPTDIEMYQLRETNSMVEEFMLLANISVAEVRII
jgi:exosome complex exonuclease DIS3/RRP44